MIHAETRSPPENAEKGPLQGPFSAFSSVSRLNYRAFLSLNTEHYFPYPPASPSASQRSAGEGYLPMNRARASLN